MSDSGDIARPTDGPVPEQPPAAGALRTVSQFGFQVGPAPNPILEKLTPENITTLIDQDGKEQDGARQFRWGILVVGVLALLAVCWMFLAYEKSDVLKDVLTHFVAFLGGAGVGWGVRRRKS